MHRLNVVISKIVAACLFAFLSVSTGISAATPMELRTTPPTSLHPSSEKNYKEVAETENPSLFRDNELQFDAFGLGDFYTGAEGSWYAGNASQSRQLSGRPAWGGGLALTYIFAKYFGVSVDQSIFGRNSNVNWVNSPSGDYADFGYTRWQTAGSVVLRYPITPWNLSPYLSIGGGAQYGNVPNIKYAGISPRYRMSGQGFGSIGGGLEYRLTPNIGIFTDLRYLFSAIDGLANNQMQWRYGLRFAF